MSITYTSSDLPPPNDRLESASEEPYIPVYARRRTARGPAQGGLRSWMILAPVGVLVLGGVAAVLLLNGGEAPVEPALNEPAVATPVLPAMAPIEAAPLATAPTTVESVPPAPMREAAPARPTTAPAEAPVAAPPAPRVETPSDSTGVQPYTTSLNTAPPTVATTPAPAEPPAPAIVVEPLG